MYGAPGRPSNEQIWDNVLSGGKLIFGVATDDAHNYLDFSPSLGWFMDAIPPAVNTASMLAWIAGNKSLVDTGST